MESDKHLQDNSDALRTYDNCNKTNIYKDISNNMCIKKKLQILHEKNQIGFDYPITGNTIIVSLTPRGKAVADRLAIIEETLIAEILG